MERSERSKLAVIFSGILNTLYALMVVWLGLMALCILTVVVNPDAWVSKYMVTSFLLKLSSVGQAPFGEVSAAAPAATVQMELMGFFKITTGNRLYNALTGMGFLAWQGLFLVFLHQLRKVFSHISEANPFADENARRISIMGFCLIGTEMVRNVVQFAAVVHLKSIISVPGARLSAMSWEFYWQWLRPEIIFSGFAILVLAEVFKKGIRLRRENELTI